MSEFNILDFFDFSKKTPEIVVDSGLRNGRIVPANPVELFNPLEVRKEREQERIRRAIEQEAIMKMQLESEAKRYAQSPDLLLSPGASIDGVASSSRPGPMSDIDTIVPSTLATLPNMDDVNIDLTAVYGNYEFSHIPDKTLPIYKHKQKILSVINSNLVTIIQGETGCGKSTQVPQYILDDAVEQGKPCNIVITQPRRIAAMSLAKRVSDERRWPFPSLVGYQIGLDNKTTLDTRINYCTTGVLLMKLVCKKGFDNYTHVILDEVHERDQDMDFTLILIKLLLKYGHRNVKIVLMSATFNVERFSSYFVLDEGFPAPIIDLEKSERKGYMINTYYMCQLGILGLFPEVRADDPRIDDESYEIAQRLIVEFDALERKDVRWKKGVRGAVLVFLPGINEIEEMYSKLKYYEAANKWWIRPLHSTITLEEQHAAFKRASDGHRKIILSTNIAESSITVPDIVYVIDFCRTKHLICDPVTNYTSLQLCWASKTNCIQRAGRSGRVCEGRVYRLVPRAFYETTLKEDSEPEIKRAPLSSCVLKSKILNMGSPAYILSHALDSPDIKNIESTIMSLKEAGALYMEPRPPINYYDGEISYFGRVMSRLPLDIRVSRLIILGHMFGVLEECIIMAAALSLKSMFSTPFQQKIKAYNSKLKWADGSSSDLISCLTAYTVWNTNCRDGYYNRSAGQTEKEWAKKYYIQLQVLKEMKALIEDIKRRLKGCGIQEIVGDSAIKWSEVEKPVVLKVVIAGAFYPNYFVRTGGGQDFEQQAVKQVGGHDPFTTVYFQNFPSNQPGKLYEKHFKNYLRECSHQVDVRFDPHRSNKVYVVFPRAGESDDKDLRCNATISEKIPNALYRAVKLRKCDELLSMKFLPPEVAMERARQLGFIDTDDANNSLTGNVESLMKNMRPKLPPLSQLFMDLQVCHVVDPSHFWAQDQEFRENLKCVDTTINDSHYSIMAPLTSDPVVGKIYLAPFTDLGVTRYYRARVISVLMKKTKVQIYYIDYGNSEIIDTRNLRQFTNDDYALEILKIKPQAFECVLSEVKPSLLKNPRGMWSEDSVMMFSKLVNGRFFAGQIFSVVQGVVSLELFPYEADGRASKISINEWLRENKYAELAEESYLSKVDHDARTQAQLNVETYDQSDTYETDAIRNEYWSAEPTQEVEPPHPRECMGKSVPLKGPISPLEITVYGTTLLSHERTLSIEGSSINSVLLDTEPQDMHQRLVVASEVVENPEQNTLILRQTTVMPNIHGFPALMAMLFCPKLELRVDSSYTKFIGAICGMGADRDSRSKSGIYVEHDMEVVFDVEFSLQDLEEINKIRFWMNKFASCGPNDDMEEALITMDAEVVKCQKKVKKFLMSLLNRSRRSLHVAQKGSPKYQWGLLDESRTMNPLLGETDESRVFPLHWGVSLEPEDEEVTLKMVKHLKNLKMMVNSGPVKEVKCELCQVLMTSVQQLRLHLEGAHHKEKENHLRKQKTSR